MAGATMHSLCKFMKCIPVENNPLRPREIILINPMNGPEEISSIGSLECK